MLRISAHFEHCSSAIRLLQQLTCSSVTVLLSSFISDVSPPILADRQKSLNEFEARSMASHMIATTRMETTHGPTSFNGYSNGGYCMQQRQAIVLSVPSSWSAFLNSLMTQEASFIRRRVYTYTLMHIHIILCTYISSLWLPSISINMVSHLLFHFQFFSPPLLDQCAKKKQTKTIFIV